MDSIRRIIASIVISLWCSITAAAQSPPTRDAMLDAHVRVILEPRSDPGSRFFGSGVVVFSEPGLTEILTCRHNIMNRGGYNLKIEDDDGVKNRFRTGKILQGAQYGTDTDFAIVTLHNAPAAAGAARIAPFGYTPVNPVYSIGSDEGGSPTIWTGNIVEYDVDQPSESGHTVAHNMIISHGSKEGRSGGAVYDSNNWLIGITWGSLHGKTRAVNLTRVKYGPLTALQKKSGQVLRESSTIVASSPGKPQQEPARPVLRPVVNTPTPQVQTAPPAAAVATMPSAPTTIPASNIPALSPPAVVASAPLGSRILFFHRSNDPVELYRAAIGDPNAQFLNAESDEAARQAAAIWGVRTLPAALAVVPNPDGSYRSIGQLYGPGITVNGIRAIAAGKVVSE